MGPIEWLESKFDEAYRARYSDHQSMDFLLTEYCDLFPVTEIQLQPLFTLKDGEDKGDEYIACYHCTIVFDRFTSISWNLDKVSDDEYCVFGNISW